MGFLVFLAGLLLGSVLFANSSLSRGLSANFYESTCPNVEEIIKRVLEKKMNEKPTPNITLPGTLRLFFHDCFVQGCDGSVLIASTADNRAERDAPISLSLAGDGFDIVVRAKKVLEESCPGVVSCADILAILARDVVVTLQGPHWEVEKGRRDGRISKADNVAAQIPRAESNLTDLVRLFQSKGLKQLDLLTLSGAHTVGFSHCSQFANRIHNHDPTMDPTMRDDLISACPFPKIDQNVAEALDRETPFVFDNVYFKNLRHQKGLLTSDQSLFSGGDVLSRKMVFRYAENQTLFFSAFAAAMHKLGRVGIKTGMEGEIRKDCTKFN